MHITKWKPPIPTVSHSGKGKTMEKMRRSVVVRAGWGEMNEQRTEDR